MLHGQVQFCLPDVVHIHTEFLLDLLDLLLRSVATLANALYFFVKGRSTGEIVITAAGTVTAARLRFLCL